MVKRKGRIFGILLIVVLMGAVLIYKRPMTIEQRMSSFDFNECTELRLTAVYHPEVIGDPIVYERTLTAADEDYDVVIKELQSHPFSRSFMDIFNPSYSKEHTSSGPDFQWWIHCYFEDKHFFIYNFYGQISLEYAENEDYTIVTTSAKEEWLDKIFELIKKDFAQNN